MPIGSNQCQPRANHVTITRGQSSNRPPTPASLRIEDIVDALVILGGALVGQSTKLGANGLDPERLGTVE